MKIIIKSSKIILTGLILILVLSNPIIANDNQVDRLVVFENASIHFNPDNPALNSNSQMTVTDNGRVIQRSVELPNFRHPTRITAHVIIKPIPKDDISMHDKWDRAGSIRLTVAGQPDLELVKFMTAYGGRTEWSVDISHIAPLLKGPVTITAFIDTWVSPAWLVDFSITFTPDSALPNYQWVTPLFFENSFDLATYADTGITIETNITGKHQRVMLYYLVSGHCTDGRDADEFVKKDNVLPVDNFVVYRYQPWRDDCRQFRDINPYTRRWSDGFWSSDYSRSGWCPGDIVIPQILDLSDHLTLGNHNVGINIESIRPKGSDNHFGYWRVSAYLVGMTDPK